jgi:hypothetical protein
MYVAVQAFGEEGLCPVGKDDRERVGGRQMEKRVKFLLVATVALACAQVATAGPTWVLLEELSVPAQGGIVTSSVTLAAGATYRLEASGTFSAGADITADAEYSSGPDSYVWQDVVEKYESYGEGLLELKVNGAFVEWGPYNPDHVYTLDIVGTGDPVQFDFEIYDIFYSNNTGSLTARIYGVPAPGAMLLGSLGAGLVGFWRRRRAL